MKKLILIAVLPAIVIYISIPFVAKYIVSEPEEAGEIFILHETITNKYIKNAKSGTLLVVTGKVRNDYSDKRNHIKITGKLFSENIKQPSSQAAAYCGNILTDRTSGSL